MIYLDNAATTMMKPECVVRAVADAMTSFGGVGRGVHPASIAAGMAVYRARAAVANLLGAPGASSVAFTNNATMALNIAIDGLLAPGQRALTTAASHNSVLRPLFRLRDTAGCSVDIAPIAADGSLDFETYAELLKHKPALVAVTHASNLTGDVYDVARMCAMAHEAGAKFVLDAAQTAGSYPLNMAEIGADVVCFTGHKSLLGPQGTGGLCVACDIEIAPLLEGGSGTHSYDERHPLFMPERLEAGTLNAHGVAGLVAGIGYIEGALGGPSGVHEHAGALAQHFADAVSGVSGVKVYGRSDACDRGSIVALNIADVDSAEVADRLASDYDICVRAGAHCAPLMHKALGTQSQGAVRFSFAAANTVADADAAAEAVREIARAVPH